MKLRIVAPLLISLAAFTATAGEDAHPSFGLESAGFRYGFGQGVLARHFQEAEALVDFTLPQQWDLGRSWELKPRLELSLGSFGNDHTTAFIGSVPVGVQVRPAREARPIPS